MNPIVEKIRKTEAKRRKLTLKIIKCDRKLLDLLKEQMVAATERMERNA